MMKLRQECLVSLASIEKWPVTLRTRRSHLCRGGKGQHCTESSEQSNRGNIPMTVERTLYPIAFIGISADVK